MNTRLSNKTAQLIVLIIVAVSLPPGHAEVGKSKSSSVSSPISGLTKSDPFLENILSSLDKRKATPNDLESLSTYIKENPSSPDGHLVLSRAYFSLGMDNMYAEEMEKAWILSPTHVSFLLAALKAQTVWNDSASLKSLVDKSLEVYRDNVRMLLILAKQFQAENRPAVALRFFERAHQLDPQNRNVLKSFCTLLLSRKEYARVLSESRPLLSENDPTCFAQLLTGLAYTGLGSPEAALPFLEKAHLQNPSQAEIAEAYADCLVALGKTKEALQPSLVALAMQTPYAGRTEEIKLKIRPLISLAKTAELKGAIQTVVKLNPPANQLAFFYFAFGDLLDKSGKVSLASGCFTDGLNLDGSFGRGYMRLARDYELLGKDSDLILNLYQRAVENAPDDKEVQSRYERMKSRMLSSDHDIAAKLKAAINSVRY
ncbi:MAG: tetratricopeptide repeat protein [Candidatus Obscuribacterales bacterium]|nr:tetratricopeptide repeat protein [Candidatus Obscuribacterales bacterium]